MVTIRVTFIELSVSMFCFASRWKVYSSPILRAGSPVQASRCPRIAKSTRAAFISLAVEIAA